MPLGKQHTAATIALAWITAISGGAYAIKTGDAAPLLLAPGVLAGLMLTPDLDVDDGSISDKHARKLGCLFGWVWYWYWRPYAWVMKHRGASHWPVIGTMVRVAYAFWWMVFIPSAWPLREWALWPVGALILTDCLHVAMDWLI
jgi:uncharacterized metal-binding protein